VPAASFALLAAGIVGFRRLRRHQAASRHPRSAAATGGAIGAVWGRATGGATRPGQQHGGGGPRPAKPPAVQTPAQVPPMQMAMAPVPQGQPVVMQGQPTAYPFASMPTACPTAYPAAYPSAPLSRLNSAELYRANPGGKGPMI